MKKINQNLSEIFDVEPIVLEETKEVSTEIVESNFDNSIDADTELARNNIKALINKGNKAVDELLIVARDSQQPRAYEVMSTLIKNMSEINKDLLQIQKTKKELNISSDKNNSSLNVDKAVFVGSTDELIKFIKNK